MVAAEDTKVSDDLILWRLESLEAGQRGLERGQQEMQSDVSDIKSSLKSYRAVWKFAVAAAGGGSALLTLLFRWFE